jgi:phenylpyruvate tautomerase PptA (4-oxalocrotonate tautomerase family)
MPVRVVRATLWILWAVVLWAIPAVSWAGEAEEDPVRNEARQLAYEGIKALRAERYAEALSFLRQAEQKFHAPTHLLYMARAHVGLGELIAAHGKYVTIAIEPIPNYAAAAFHQARKEAAAERQQLQARVATVTVEVAGADVASVSVSVDGKTVEPARLAHPIAVTAGEHRIAAVGTDGQRAEQVATVAVGESKTVTLSIEPESAPAPGPGSPGQSAPDSADGSGLTAAGAVLVAVGGAALVVGGITGGMTLSRAGDIEDTCGGDVCPTTEEPTVDDAKTLGNVSTALFIAGGVVAATGVVLLVVAPGDESEAATAHGPRLELRATVFGASLSGTF